ncbi:MAG: hypothetical protein KGQ26_09065 [Rhodospirillales bacterium]|nr:hypothetical protein [Rhodospirillales bacterium]MDE2318118.1 hypothetical protein [Rhodospirillales bacterium]
MTLNQNRPGPPLPGIALLTWFGTLICLDTRANRVVHQGLENLAPWHLPVGLEPKPESGGFGFVLAHQPEALQNTLLAELTPGEGAVEGCVQFFHDGLFLSAKPDGSLELGAKVARDWEQFLPLRPRDAQMLREILARFWSVEGRPPVPAGLGEFRLKFGGHAAKLSAILPFPPETLVHRLSAAVAGGEAISVPKGQGAKQVWINHLGNIGNRAMQFLTATSIAARVPGAEVRNIHLDMWGRVEPAPRPPAWASAGTGTRFHIDVEGLADCLRRDVVDAVCVEGYAFHLDHFPPREQCRALFPPTLGQADARGFGRHELVCSVRAAEILRVVHPDYVPLPPGYYARLQEETGLDLVFFGQLGDDPYSTGLRAAFPKARFIPGTDQNHDFEVLRRSANIALSISTFAWLAAWLGEAERIYMPVGGMFHPIQHPDFILTPLDEPAYRFMLLPPVKAVNPYENITRFLLMQETIARHTRPAEVEELREILLRSRKLGRGMVPVKGFDSTAYLAANPDVAHEVRALRQTALNHCLTVDERMQRLFRVFDPLFYAFTYPDAAEAVSLGHYPDLWTHFRVAGEALGYAPSP